MSFLRACDNEFVKKFQGISIPQQEDGQLQEVPAIWGLNDVKFEEQFTTMQVGIATSLQLPLIGIYPVSYTDFFIANEYGFDDEGLNFKAHYGVTVWTMYESCRVNILEHCVLLQDSQEKIKLNHIMLDSIKKGQLTISRAHMSYSFNVNVKLEKEND
jgi:hypothetical protein